MADGEGKKSKDRPYWLPFVIALVMLLWLTYLFRNPDMVDRTQFTFSEWVTIGYLVTVVMLIWLLIWKITLNTEVATEAAAAAAAAAAAEKPKKKAKPKPTPPEPLSDEEIDELDKAPPKPKKKRVVVASGAATGVAAKLPHDDELPEGLKRPEDVITEEVEDMKDMPRVVEYPAKEPGGVYSDTLMKVDESLVLNYRILLGKVCHNCEELDDCKKRVMGKLDDDIFLYNFACKDGIKAELNRARKEREAEEEKADAAKEMVEKKAAEAKEEEPEPEEEEKPKKKPPAKKKSTKKTTKKKSTSGTKKKSPPKKKPKADE